MGQITIEGSQWADYNFKARDADQRQISDRRLAKLLEPYEVRPEGIRIGDTVRKGYKIAKLKPVFSRYLDSTPNLAVTALQANNQAAFSPKPSVTTSENITDENRRKHNNRTGCNGVTAVEPETDEIDHDRVREAI